MRKNNTSNSDLIQRLQTLLAESDQRTSNPPKETNQEPLEEIILDLLKNKNDSQQKAAAEEINQEILEEPTQDISINELEIKQNEPPEEIIQESLEEVMQYFTSSGSEMIQDKITEEVIQEPVEKNDISAQSKNKLPEGGNMPQVYDVNYKNIVIKTSDGSVISGKTNINVFGRLTEYLKQGTDNFITVVSEEEEDASKRVTVVNKNYIIWANTWD